MKVLFILVLVSAGMAEDFVEFRSASRGEYRYVDWGHSFKNGVASDIYYVGVPGSNEFVGCIGYSLPSFKGVSITPYGCGSKTKEEGKGVKIQAVITWSRGKWQADAFWARAFPVSGQAAGYDVVDAANLTRSFGNRWELGVSGGFFHQGNGQPWNPLFGPLVRYKDNKGSWGFSYRVGSAQEIRFARTITFGKR